MKEVGKRQRNREREITVYTRFLNHDGTFEEFQDALGEGDFESPLEVSSGRRSDGAKHHDLARGRQYLRIFTIEGIPDRKFHLDKIGGNGWSFGAGSMLSEIEGPTVGAQYLVDAGRGITF